MSDTVALSVIIVAYKNWEVLLKALKSIEEYNDIGNALEIIVVDNSPEDARIKEYLPKDYSVSLTYVPSDNRGFGAGNNDGEKIAKGEYIAFINPDIILIEPVFKKIIDVFESDKTVCLAGLKLLDKNKKWTFSFYYDYEISFFSKQIIKLRNECDQFNQKTMFICGADMFMRKSTFDDAGHFDENIFMYYEESDLTRRIKKIRPDARIVYIKDAKMIHLEKQSSGTSETMVKQQIQSCIYYGKKYGLDYRKKIDQDYKYLRFKKRICSIIGKKSDRFDASLVTYETCINNGYQI